MWTGSRVTLVLFILSTGWSLRSLADPTYAQQSELTASSGAAGDELGISVATSDGAAIVGATETVPGSGSTGPGAAYVFNQDGGAWLRGAKLAPSDGATNDSFGWSVSLSGELAVVGAPLHAVAGKAAQGAAYVFSRNGSTWAQQAELTATDGVGGDSFGWSVAVSGGVVLVGAIDHSGNGNSAQGQGSAYVFTQTGTAWTQQAELTASDGAEFDTFGWAVGLSGGTAVVGAEGHTVGSNDGQGAAYVFTQNGDTWSQVAELAAADGTALDGFGSAVSVSGATILVGAETHAVGSNLVQGAAYIFVPSGSAWVQQAELIAADGAAYDQFGVSAALAGSTAIVGANQHAVGSNASQGAAYVFSLSGTTWSQQAELTSSDGASGDDFGFAVGGADGEVVVGAFGHTANGNSQQGAAYVFGPGADGSFSSSSSGTSNATSGSGSGGSVSTGVSVSTLGSSSGESFVTASATSNSGASTTGSSSTGSGTGATTTVSSSGATSGTSAGAGSGAHSGCGCGASGPTLQGSCLWLALAGMTRKPRRRRAGR